MENNNFMSFLNPILKPLDNGDFFRKPFYWLYALIGILNPIGALYLLIETVTQPYFKFISGGAKFMFILFWIIIAAFSIAAFMLWWNRKDRVREIAEKRDNFIAIPVVTHLIQTIGEWLGMLVAVLGFFATIFILISPDLRGLMPTNEGAWGLILFPVFGFLIVVMARFVAEAWRALAAIANNTKRMADRE